jgi:S1-C subfamily serine protease
MTNQEIKPPIASNKKQNTNKPGYCGIIILTVVVSLLMSLIVGFAASGLGKILVEKLTGQEVETITQQEKVEEESATISAVEKVKPAVVSIVVTKDLQRYYRGNSPFSDPFFRNFFNDFGINEPEYEEEVETEKQKIGGGTGFIISSDGMILTNRHVVSDNGADYTVVTNDGEEYEARILAIDPLNDVAIAKIDANDLPIVELGDSDSLKEGQTAIAIGYTLGEYHNTVTKGVISGLSRAITAGGISDNSKENLENIIQTDAAINPGNSGGPLVNLSGQVIGINTAVDFSGQLIGFAIPINDAKEDINSVKDNGKIVKPYLGVRYVLINKKIAEENNLEVDYGALVIRGEGEEQIAVIPGSPADKAEIVENDIILEIDGKKIKQGNDLQKVIGKYKVGQEIKVKIWHKGEEKEITVKLEERK